MSVRYFESLPKGIVVDLFYKKKLFVFSYTADENGYHPIITEEAAPSLVANRAVQSMYSSDVDEEFKVTLTEEDVELARKKSQEARSRSKQLQLESSESVVVDDVRSSKSIQPDSPTVRKRVFTNTH